MTNAPARMTNVPARMTNVPARITNAPARKANAPARNANRHLQELDYLVLSPLAGAVVPHRPYKGGDIFN
jgi:hypothetical protein